MIDANGASLLANIKKKLTNTLEVCGKATEGPWEVKVLDTYEETVWLDGDSQKKPPTIHDLNFIDDARTALPQMARALEVAMEFLDEAREVFKYNSKAEEWLGGAVEQIARELSLAPESQDDRGVGE